MPSANGHGSRKAILYARVSTEEQARREGNGIRKTVAEVSLCVSSRYGIQVLAKEAFGIAQAAVKLPLHQPELGTRVHFALSAKRSWYEA